MNNTCFKCNDNRTQILNDRIYTRNIPSNPLPPQFSMRPVSTKYATMPILDQRRQPTIPLNNCQSFNVNTTFNPGNAQAPWSGYASNIHLESTLRNQFFALQKSDQSKYIPSSSSDLYNIKVDAQPVKQPFPHLFEKSCFDSFNPNHLALGKELFNNATRNQMQNKLDEDCC
jgi:hypothetical protein